MSTLFIKRNNRYYPADPAQVMSEAAALYKTQFKGQNPLTSPQLAKDYLQTTIGAQERENFLVIFLDNQNRVIESEILFTGTIDGAAIYPREVVKRSLHHNAAAVMLAHNHPSGLAEPSRADKAITEKLKQALELIDVSILDHFIVGTTIYSFLEGGIL